MLNLVKKKTSKAAKKKTQKKVSAAKPKTQEKKALDAAKAFALAAAKVAAERHCSEIVVLDLSGKSPATDYFVIATGTSDRQMRTVADEINEAAREIKFQRFGRAGYEQARWILLDYVDVVIHIFDSEYRDYYDLELLWGDAERLNIDE
jgi:ribosome-associated protein